MLRVREVIGDLNRLAHDIVDDFRTWPSRGPRHLDEIETVLSVLFAIANSGR
jgi:hypothetical protein